jgi:DNA-binding XRE family transcriptional regulator
MRHSLTTLKVAKRTEEARKRANVSKADLARALDVSRHTVYKMLRGDSTWSSDEIALAADRLDVTPEHLLGLEDGAA